VNSLPSKWGVNLPYFLLLFVSLIFLVLTLQNTHREVGRTFPGSLSFKNGVRGVYFSPAWHGSADGIFRDLKVLGPEMTREEGKVFTERDYFFVVLVPALSGLLLLLLGTVLCRFLSPETWRTPLFLIHFLIGNYLIVSPEAQMTYQLYLFQLAFFVFLPAPVIQLALLFPEREEAGAKSFLNFVPYGLSGLVLIPYVYFFIHSPLVWVRLEFLVYLYLLAGSLFWMGRLIASLRGKVLEFNRIIARYLLIGQIGLIIPFAAGIPLFFGRIAIPSNLTAPLTLLFPVTLLIGILIARLRQSQIQLFQSKKRAALGNLLAGLAHELNNPITFLYSNIEPLKETVDYIKKILTAPDEKTKVVLDDLDLLVKNMEEGADRVRSIIHNFRYFSYPDRPEPQAVDLHQVLNQSLALLTPKWKNRVRIVQDYGPVPKIQGSPGEISQVFVNILANACDVVGLDGTIEIVTEHLNSKVQVRIRDSGPGIRSHFISKIFDPFYTTKDQGEGTGLGLSIAVQIVESHKGKIEVKSETGQGTEFIVTLPVSLS